MRTVVVRVTRTDGTSPVARMALRTPAFGPFAPGVPWWGCHHLRDALSWFGSRAGDYLWALVVCDASQLLEHRERREVVVHGPGNVVWSGGFDELATAAASPLMTFARRHKAWVRLRRMALRLDSETAG